MFPSVPPTDGAEAEAWLSVLGPVTIVAYPILPNGTAGVSVKCLPVDQAATAR